MAKKNYLGRYAAFLRRHLKIQKPMRVVFDCSNGTAGLILKKTFGGFKGIEAIYINDQPDGRFPAHDPNPLAPHALDQLSAAVKKARADVGIAFDADGDRAFFVDNAGQPLPSYLILYLLSRDAKPPFIADIITFEALKYSGLINEKDLIASKVGARLVKEKMKEYGASVGGEFSCHFFFNDFFNSDSGILTAAKVISRLSSFPYTLNDFCQLVPKTVKIEYHTIELENPKTAGKLIAAFEKKYRRQALAINRIDGLTFEFPNGWFIVRQSNSDSTFKIFIGQLS